MQIITVCNTVFSVKACKKSDMILYAVNNDVNDIKLLLRKKCYQEKSLNYDSKLLLQIPFKI